MNTRINHLSPLIYFVCVLSTPLGSQAAELDLVTAISGPAEGRQALRSVPGEIIVKYRTQLTTPGENALKTMGLSEHIRVTSGNEYVYSLPAERIGTLSAISIEQQMQAAVSAMSARDDVEYAQPNYLLEIVRVPNDPGFPLQWHYFTNGAANGESPGGINLPGAWDISVGDPNIVIAVIDTGILPNHADIAGSPNLAAGYDMISSSARANDGDGRDNDPTDAGDANAANECFPGSPARGSSWHGTHVAGTVGIGQSDNENGVAGVNWSTRVQAIRVLGKCGGSTTDINDGIRWAAGMPVPGVPVNPNPARVINMSLGAGAPCGQSPSTQSAINDVVALGVTVVVAAGNEAQDASGSFPASCNNVITVAASDYNGNLVTRYSNFGSTVEIMAPGGDTQADVNNDNNPDGVLSMVQGGFAFFNGTSMASPHVAGVVGLLLAQDANLTPQEISNLIQDNAIPRTPQQCPRPCGAGLLNANILVGTNPPPTPSRPLVLSVSPIAIDVDKDDTVTLTATVMRDNAAVAGEIVSFSVSNTAVATIAPDSNVTNANGTAQAIVTGIADGDTSVEVRIQGASQSTPLTVSVTVSATAIDLLLLSVLFALTLFATFRKLRPGHRLR